MFSKEVAFVEEMKIEIIKKFTFKMIIMGIIYNYCSHLKLFR